MRHIISIIFLIFLYTSVYGDLGELYSERLQQDPAYMQSLLKLEEAELGLAYYDRNFIPTVSVNTSSSQGTPGPGIINGEFLPYTLNSQLVLNNIFGSTIQLSVPYTWDTVSGHRIESPTLIISRPLFSETTAEYFKVKALVLESDYALQQIKLNTGINLVRDITTAYYNIKAEGLYDEYTTILQENLAGVKVREDRNTIKRKLYAMEKLFLKAEHEKADTDIPETIGPGELKALYKEVEDMALLWEKEVESSAGPGKTPGNITSLEYSLKAAEREAAFWFLPFLPNPTLYASLSYNREGNRVDWGLGFSVTVLLVDHGDRELESRKRKMGQEIAQRELENTISDYKKAVNTLLYDIEVIRIDLKILELDKEDTHTALLEAEQLYEKKIINKNDYTMRKLDHELAVLAYMEKKNTFYIKLLNLLALENKNIGGFLHEEDY
jgi:hypothetical protein